MDRMAETVARAERVRLWFARLEAHLRLNRWTVGVFLSSFALLLGLSEWLVARIGVTGDEPWYLLQAYGLLHLHSSNLTPLLSDPRMYARFLGTHADTHTRDFMGHGVRVLFYLPGYAATIAPLYALGGRPLIVAFQSLVAALTAALLFDESRRLFGSQWAAVFAWLAFLGALPVLLYTGQIFPSTLATFTILLGFVLVTRWLPNATGRRVMVLSIVIGLLAFWLPWLHFKYSLPALVLAGGALAVLRAHLRWPIDGEADRRALYAAAVVTGLTALSFALIVLYSRHYFGAWTPPSATERPDLLHPHPERIPGLYVEMFLSQQLGLLPWVPLDLLVLPGLVVLLRHHAAQGRYLLILVGSLLVTFASTMVTFVFQGYAFPGRFTLECAPFFALAVAALVAAGWQPVRGWWLAVAAWQPGRRGATDQTDERAPTGRHKKLPGAKPKSFPGDRRWQLVGSWTGGVGALAALALLAASCWFSVVGESDPRLLYPSFAGVRLAAAHPQAMPGVWFALFPQGPHAFVTRNTMAFDSTLSAGYPVRGTGGERGFLGRPSTLTAGTVLARTTPTDVPAGNYVATFALACDGGPHQTTALRLMIVRSSSSVNRRSVPLSQRLVAMETCEGLTKPLHVAVPFASDGYRAMTFIVEFAGTTPAVAWSVAYAPASGRVVAS